MESEEILNYCLEHLEGTVSVSSWGEKGCREEACREKGSREETGSEACRAEAVCGDPVWFG